MTVFFGDCVGERRGKYEREPIVGNITYYDKEEDKKPVKKKAKKAVRTRDIAAKRVGFGSGVTYARAYYEAEAKERQKLSQGRGKKGTELIPEVIEEPTQESLFDDETEEPATVPVGEADRDKEEVEEVRTIEGLEK